VSPTYAADALGGGGGALRSVLGRKDVRAKFRVGALNAFLLRSHLCWFVKRHQTRQGL